MPRTPASPPRPIEPAPGPVPVWPRLAGPLATLLVVAGIEALSLTPLRVPNPALIYVVVVAWSAYVGGLGPGLMSAALTLAHAVHYFAVPGRPLEYTDENLRRLVLDAVVISSIALMVGVLKRRTGLEFEDRYARMVRDLNAVVWEADPAPEGLRFSFVSPRAQDLLGFPVARWLSEPGFLLGRIHPDDREGLRRRMRDLLATGGDRDFEYRVIAADGRVVWIRDRVQAAPPGRRRPGRLRGVMVDITEQRRAVEALRASERRLSLVVSHAPVALFALDRDGTLTLCEGRGLETLQVVPDQILGRPITDLFPERPEILDGVGRALAGENVHRTVEIAGVVFDTRIIPLRAAGGAVEGAIGVATDVTERVHADWALRKSETSYRLLMQQASEAIIVTDLEGRCLDANPRACEMVGFELAELTRMRLHDLVDPDDLRRQPSRLADVRAGRTVVTERVFRRRDGELLMVEMSAKMLEDGRIQAICRDISDRKRAEAELQRTLSLLSATLESTTDGILVVDKAARITSYNRRFAEMWRLPESVMATRADEKALEHALPLLVDPEGFLAKVRELYALPEAESFDELRLKDGRIFERYSIPQRVGGVAVGRVWSFRDVTERRRAEAALRERDEQLRQAQKMEAIGRLAGGIAHDFNNLLTAIIGHASLLKEGLRPVDPLRAETDEVLRAAERAGGLTRQLLAFSRRQVLEARVFDLNALLGELTGMLVRIIGEDVELTVTPGERLGRVRADRGQIEQAIVNLAVNARDAMPEGGRLEIAAANLDLDSPRAAYQATIPPGPYVVLTVADTGVGMDAATRERAFEPFFTTKPLGQGTGLGLALVYGTVRQSGGYIALDSTPGSGTRFEFYFPRVVGPLLEEEEQEHPGQIPRGSETVLLVEDEAAVRGLLHRTLEHCGYTVLVADGGEAALRLAERHPGPIHLLVTDVVMPGIGGREVSERLGGWRPGIATLFISGYTSDAIVHREALEPGMAFLQKPFGPDTLARAVRMLLDARRGAARPGARPG